MRFGRRGLPELVHEFSIDPPAVPFISDKPLRAPACLLPTPPLSFPPPPHAAAREKLHAQCLSPPSGFPSLGKDPRPPLTSLPTQTRRVRTGLLPSGGREGAHEGRGCGLRRGRTRGGYTGSPNFRGYLGIALCPGPHEALRWHPAPSPPGSRRRPVARATAPQEPYVNPGAGWVSVGGWEGVWEKGK